MNKKLQKERAEALELLSAPSHSLTVPFNLSDLKSDKTQFFESPFQKSKFEPSEISARSTILQKHTANQAANKTFDDEFDAIMRSSSSHAVKNKYRESMGRLSFFPRTADMSMRSSVSSSVSSANEKPSSVGNFWDQAMVSSNSFGGKNYSVASDGFAPGEQMINQLEEDEMEQQNEFATLPNVQKTLSNESNWENRNSMRQPEMSFGQYAQNYLGGNDIRNIYGNKSPAKRNRVALVELDNTEAATPTNGSELTKMQKLIKNSSKSKAEELFLNLGKEFKKTNDIVGKNLTEESDPVLFGINKMLGSINFEEIMQRANKETVRMEAESKKENNLEVPTHDHELHQSRSACAGRGTKRRSSSVNDETPKSALDKCMRSKSPALQRELQAAAASMLKPKLANNVFKVPNSVTTNPLKSPPRHSTLTASPPTSAKKSTTFCKSSSSREYITASSMLSPGEKLSLPNYGLVRPESLLTSPTSSIRSSDRRSNDGQLKRTVSQISNGSEFHDDVLPIKIQKSSRKLSWPTVKLYQAVVRTISIQNGSNKKLPLRVRIKGVGFSVSPREDLRMIPQEARTFEVKFSPTNIGPAHGQLIFELATNSKCVKIVPLFAYGGHTMFRIDGTQKGPIGPAFITMGQVKMLNGAMNHQIRLTNTGTLPGFASLWFDYKAKWADFAGTKSLETTPSQVRLAPGQSTVITVKFKATKEEIRKIISLNKEVTIIGEIVLITGDEPTRLRMLRNKDTVPRQVLRFLPESMDGEFEYKQQMALFNENMDRAKLSPMIDEIRIHEIAVTINRSLDETQIFAAELSMADDTNMSFETFCDTRDNQTVVEPSTLTHEDYDESDVGYLECKYFRIVPAQIIFSRSKDMAFFTKTIIIESSCADPMYAEALSTNPKYVAAKKSCGVINPGESVEIKVTPLLAGMENRFVEPIAVSIIIDNAKVDVPVKFVD